MNRDRCLNGTLTGILVLAGLVLAWLLQTVSHEADPSILGSEGALTLAWVVGHCDGLDGPVVRLARRALQSGNVNIVLGWVRPEQEPEVRQAFEHAVSVRKLGPQACTLADTHFFETLVRLHRSAEGAPFSGLKPAGRDLGPAIQAADQALEDGSVDRVVHLLTEAVRQGVHAHFHAAMARKTFDENDVSGSRAFVAAYVAYIHYVERLWRDIAGPVHGHAPAPSMHEH